jgi:hypothetical protein
LKVKNPKTAGERVSAKVGVVKDPARNLRDRREGREVVIAVHADEV